MYVYYTVAIVPGNHLRSGRWNLKSACMCIFS